MIENYKAALFDLDGTLIDSMWMWHEIDELYLKKFNLEVPDDLASSIEGMGFSETAVYFKKRFKLNQTIEQIKSCWNEMAFDIYCNKVPLKNGVIEFLEFLKEKGIKCAIGTSNSIDLAKAVIKSLGIDKYFDSLVTACMVNASKPKPDIYLAAARDLNVDNDKCIVFEDIPQGIISGHSAGMTTVAVEDDYSLDLTEKKKELADYYIKDYYEFMERYCI